MWYSVQGALASGLALGKLSMAVAYARPALGFDRGVPLVATPDPGMADRAETDRAWTERHGARRAQLGAGARDGLRALFGSFDECRMISLPGRADRRRRIARQLGRLDLDANGLGIRLFDGLQFDETDGFPSRGVRGCFNSHLALMRRCADRGRPMLVIEDDIHFLPERLAGWGADAAGIAAQPWDIAYLGYLNRVGSGAPGRLERVAGNTIGGHFYAVRPEFAGAIATFMEAAMTRPAGSPDGGRMYRDGAFNFFRARNRQWLTMASGESLASQGASRSDLTPRRCDQLPIVRQCLRAARRLRETVA